MQNENRIAHRRGIGGFGWIFVALIALLVIGSYAGPLLWGTYGGTAALNNAYPYPYPMFGWFFWPFGAFFIIFIVFFAFRWFWFPWGGRHYRRWDYWGEPQEIIKRRYARGEITKDQFDQMMRDLEQPK